MQTFVDAGVQAADADDTPGQRLKKVRVGYLIYPGYQEGEGNAPKSGYGYEYLQQIAYYAGWESIKEVFRCRKRDFQVSLEFHFENRIFSLLFGSEQEKPGTVRGIK